ncbi:MAG: hypothetical protein CR982_04475 [Candidatus Cloacimonadota bacterium]|nr:MAG: hypothetical protein CR982_04475 [Candidatus Cloacimonadota bacterium]PIE80058.1 MAG: hypothetical protein CSA15_02235 [Candidatus Delongbacteria bacterium]
MKIGILTSTISEEDFFPNIKDLKQKIELRGVEVDLFKNGEFNLMISKLGSEIFLNGEPFFPKDYDLVFNRFSVKDKTNADYYIMEEFISSGVNFFNTPLSISKARNKLLTLQILGKMGVDITKSFVIRRNSDLDNVNRYFTYPLIVKNIFGSLGSSTLIVYDFKQLKAIYDYIWNVNRNEVLMIQEFIKTEDNSVSDYRVFVAGGDIISSMKRTNHTDDFRSNYKRGADVEFFDISENEKRICIEIANRFGLKIAGIDFMRSHRGPVVLEVNSNPGLEGIRRASIKGGFDILDRLADYLISEIKS